jgi:RNA polymerase sigma-70 factor (ECF subfamily)
MTTPSDETLAKMTQGGDNNAFGILVDRYESKLLRYAKRFLFGYDDAHDLVQETFLKAYVNIKGFDISRSFSAWIYRIAHNEFINAIKKKGREPIPFFDTDTLFPHPTTQETADRAYLEKELSEMLDKCLASLDPKYREPLVLYYYEEKNYQEIAEILHLPPSTVGVRLKRAKEQLEKCYDKLNGTK